MIVFCKASGYNHTKSLRRFGNCVEFDIPGVVPLQYRNMLKTYTKIHAQYLVLWFHTYGLELKNHTWRLI